MPTEPGSAPFRSLSTEGRPEIEQWIPPPATREVVDFAKLHTIDLSLLDSPDPAVVAELVKTTKEAIQEDGFLYLVNYGVTLEQLHRQFAIGQHLHTHISEEDKKALLWDPESGSFAGYKPPYGWKREAGKLDGIKQFNFYAPQLEDINLIPECVRPFYDEIIAFCDYLSNSVNRRLLILLSRVLELPDEWLWENVQSHGGPVGQGYFRHALFQPIVKEIKEASGGLRMHGHTDYGTTTLLFSVPISSLQIWGNDDKWRYVGYSPGSLVVNLGETLEIVSGGHFKATRHRVFEPPVDQLHEERLSLVIFQASNGDFKMTPAEESPLLQREGYRNHQGVFKEFQRVKASGLPVPTSKQWREAQVSGMREVTDTERNRLNVERFEVDGKLYSKRNFHGVEVLLPV